MTKDELSLLLYVLLHNFYVYMEFTYAVAVWSVLELFGDKTTPTVRWACCQNYRKQLLG